MKFGEAHYKCKLSTADVELIRDAANLRRFHLDEARKLSDKALAEKFDTSKSHIGRIVGFQIRKQG